VVAEPNQHPLPHSRSRLRKIEIGPSGGDHGRVQRLRHFLNGPAGEKAPNDLRISRIKECVGVCIPEVTGEIG
jgi:hypothetical protein